MKKLNNFLETAPLWQVFIFGLILMGGITFLFFQCAPTRPLDSYVNLKIGTTMGFIFGGIFVLITSMARNSVKFWEYSKEVESLIDNAETKESLQSIFDNEFQVLQELQMGHPHGSRLKELYTTIKTKYKYVK